MIMEHLEGLLNPTMTDVEGSPYEKNHVTTKKFITRSNLNRLATSFFSNIPILLVQKDSAIKKVVSQTKLIRSIFKKSISTFLRGPEEATPK